MEVVIKSNVEDKFLNRNVVNFKVFHKDSPTPKRDDVKKLLADNLKISKDLIILESIKTTFGKYEISGTAHVYKDKNHILSIERKHILIRNGLIEKKSEKKEEPKPTKENKSEKKEESKKEG